MNKKSNYDSLGLTRSSMEKALKMLEDYKEYKKDKTKWTKRKLSKHKSNLIWLMLNMNLALSRVEDDYVELGGKCYTTKRQEERMIEKYFEGRRGNNPYQSHDEELLKSFLDYIDRFHHCHLRRKYVYNESNDLIVSPGSICSGV